MNRGIGVKERILILETVRHVTRLAKSMQISWEHKTLLVSIRAHKRHDAIHSRILLEHSGNTAEQYLLRHTGTFCMLAYTGGIIYRHAAFLRGRMM